ncbi:MAG: hypothetical protein WD294_16250 [Phycisphaeraceae bacterium]
MNRREQMLALGAAVAIGLLVLDSYVISPIAEAYQELEDRRLVALEELRDARSLLNAHRGAQQRYRHMMTVGLTDNASLAESQALHSMRSWAADADLTLASMQPDRRSTTRVTTGFGDQKDRETLSEIEISARASGSLESIAQLLYELETADVPVRVNRIRLAQRTGESDLALELRASTIYRETTEADE